MCVKHKSFISFAPRFEAKKRRKRERKKTASFDKKILAEEEEKRRGIKAVGGSVCKQRHQTSGWKMNK